MQTTIPERPLATDPDPLVDNPDPLGLLLGQGRDELSGGNARLRFAHRETLELQPWHLAPPLLLYPRSLLREYAFDLRAAGPLRHGQPRRLAPGHFESPPSRPRRAPHLDGVHPHEPSLRFGTRTPSRGDRLSTRLPRSE